jgi:hypothetical protein
MARKLPSGLSDRERDALAQFFAGHLSAGEFTERLAQPGPGSGSPAADTAQAPPDSPPTIDAPTLAYRVGVARRAWVAALVGICAAGGVVGVALDTHSAAAGARQLATRHHVRMHSVSAARDRAAKHPG